MRFDDYVYWYDMLKKRGVSEQSAAIMAGQFAIAKALDDGFNSLMSDYAFGALDLHTVHIRDALNSIAESIEHLPDSE